MRPEVSPENVGGYTAASGVSSETARGCHSNTAACIAARRSAIVHSACAGIVNATGVSSGNH
jgi:hypothetical protein